jgi:hypothetical protein
MVSCSTWCGPGLQHGLVRLVATFAAVAVLLTGVRATAEAQTDYYNTDAGRPIRVEDAYSVERRAFEIQLAPLRLERSRGGRYQWGLEPELAYGILPRTHIEVGVPLAYLDGGIAGRTAGLAGIDVSLFHNLNVETAIPAFAVVVSGLLPAGHLGPDKSYGTVKGIMTRSMRWARFHINGEYTVGATPSQSPEGADDVGVGAEELSRWMAGVAVDRTFPLSSLLVTGEVYAEQPLRESIDVRWNTGVGLRYQLSPRFNIDAGVGRRLTGDDQSFRATFGAAVAFGLPWRP